MSAAELSAGASTLSWLLRSPAEVAERCRANDDVKQLAAVSLAAIAVGSAAFGAAIGSFRGDMQILFAALKVPLAMLLALAICVPAFHTLAAVLGRPWPLRTVVSLTLAASARASLLLLAFAPALWLAYDCGLPYHGAALAAAAAYAVAGLTALSILLRGLGPGRGRVITMVMLGLLFFAVAGQTSWIMRPYLVRPKTKALPFVRAREGSFLDSVWTSAHSAAGIYDRDADRDVVDALDCDEYDCEEPRR